MGLSISNNWFAMSIQEHLIALRRDRQLTQQEMADLVGVHVNQIRRYEAGATQPSLDALKKIAVAMSITLDALVFGKDQRGPSDDLRLQFEALSQFDEEERKVAKAVLESLILKHNAKRAFMEEKY